MPALAGIETTGGENLIVAAHGHDAVALSVVHDDFGRIARVALDRATRPRT